MADMMAKDPARRVPSAEAVMERLGSWLEEWPISGAAVVAPPPRRRLGPPIPRARNLPPATRHAAAPPRPGSAVGPEVAQPPPRNRPIRTHAPAGAQQRPGDPGFADSPENGSENDDSASLIVQTTNGPAVPPPLPGESPDGLSDAQDAPHTWRLLLLSGLGLVGLGTLGLAIWGLVHLIRAVL